LSFGTKQHWQTGKKTKRKKPKTKFEKQIDRLDVYFSQFVRISNMDDLGLCVCVTCGNQKPWNKGMTAGHFIGRANDTYRTWWDLMNVACQCIRCNSYNEGNKYNFGLYLNKKYGEGTTTKLKIKSTKSFNPDIFDMEYKIEYYKDAVKKLKLERGMK